MKWELIRNTDGESLRTFASEEDAKDYQDRMRTLYLPAEYTFRELAPKAYAAPVAPKSRADESSHDRQARIRGALKAIDDDDDIDVTDWEAGFLETIIRGDTAGRYLSEKQIDVAEKMIEKYL